MSEIPESSKIEGLIAVAGPLVNFLLAGLAFIPFALVDFAAPVNAFLWSFISLNLLMGTFNLLPAFPMDGGRVLRAILGRNGRWLRGTEAAVRVGRVLAVGLGLAGFVPGTPVTGNFLLPIIAAWLWWVGAQELAAVRLRHAQDPFAAFSEFARRTAEDWSSSAKGGFDSTSNDARSVPLSFHVEPAPLASEARAVGTAERSPGFSDDEVERLEHFRGRLRHFQAEDD